MRILLTGSNGQLGHCFMDRIPEDWQVIATDTKELDITNFSNVSKFVDEVRPDVIVNAAAYTAVDKAETEKDIAQLVNVDGPKNLAAAAKKNGAVLIHVSTDYVFDGQQKKPYIENDLTNPLSVYGRTKLEGEEVVFEQNENSIIVRTAWVYSEYGNNFVKTMIRLASERDEIKVVDDQYGSPTYAGDIASAIISLIRAKATPGIYHYCGNQDMSWKDFASLIIMEAKNINIIRKNVKVQSITTDEYPTQATRPKFSTLNCDKIKHYGIELSSIEKNLQKVLYFINKK
ncbi:dTDP-4-dehydrorhamnose reductase [Klebsiella michiganensis]|uniref:dTDP-4-dehydrorhamnose reductase n=1 Tax=Klebsiella michiganensis TaxID=1134687 RepID=UPI0006683FFB|nr:dTDP-4-dehydrorhamnose reductase [Klebsiella michiganensis]